MGDITHVSSSDMALFLDSFKTQRHSLRISVSNLAALVGFHPFKQVPELVQQLVYQGSIGRLLLQQDAELLGLSLVSPTEQLVQLAQKAGVATEQALATALTKTSDSVEAARVIKETVIKEAKKTGRLQATELKLLQEGVRSAVDTQHGTRHEDAALDAYEQQTGWPVRERNAQVKTWEFAESIKGATLTVKPMGDAACMYRNRQRDVSSNDDNKLDDAVLDHDEENGENKEAKRPKIIDLTRDDEDATEECPSLAAVDPVGTSYEDPPFFCLLGSIDGIRDELAPNSAMNDDDSWVLRPIVVECKHRMNRIHKVPPLYEQIQTIAYCFMHGTEHADLLQVMRREVTRVERPSQSSASASESATEKSATPMKTKRKDIQGDTPSKQRLLTECFAATTSDSEERQSTALMPTKLLGQEEGAITGAHAESSACTGHSDDVFSELPPPLQPLSEKENDTDVTIVTTESESNDVAQVSFETKTERAPLSISVSRVSLDDPIFQHRTQWHEVVLPRLRSIVDAVYTIRSDDDKRYRLLASMSDVTVDLSAWQLIFDECPWMKHCDTAYSWAATAKS